MADFQQLYKVREELQKIKFKNQNIFKTQEVSRRSQLWNILGTTQEKNLAINMQVFSQRNEIKQLEESLIPLLLQGYKLTSKILQELNIIHSVKTVMTMRAGTTFVREENFNIQPSDLVLELHRGAITLRFKESEVRSRLLDGKNIKELSETSISQHYGRFVQDIQKTAVNPNWGIVAEAFERHWEDLKRSEYHQTMNNPSYPDWQETPPDSDGEAWQLYHASRGNAPYYTGPDTELSQVKSANASLVSNINTILQTIQAIIILIETNVTQPSGVEYVKQQFLKAFAPEREKINKQGADLIQATVQELIKGFST